MGCYKNNLSDNPKGLACSLDAQGNFVVGFGRYLENVNQIQVRDGLDVFSDDYRNRGIWVSDAVFTVLRQIAGDPSIETVINNTRMRASMSE